MKILKQVEFFEKKYIAKDNRWYISDNGWKISDNRW